MKKTVLSAFLAATFPLLFAAIGFGQELKGFNLTSWAAGQLSSKPAMESLDQLKETNVNCVMVVCTYYQDFPESNRVFAHPERTPTKEDIVFVMEEARKRGFKTGIKMHVDLLRGGGWRGNIEPENPDAWFGSYLSFAMAMAEIGQIANANLLIFGTEMKIDFRG